MEYLTATTDDGVELALRRVPPSGASRRGVCLCTHAMMARGSYFHARGGGFAAHLAAAGIDTFVLDWRGHGDSTPPAPRRDSWSFDDYVERDLPVAIAAVCEAAAIEPTELCYLGHSLGGLVGLAALGTGAIPRVGSLSLWATSVWLPGPAGSLVRRGSMRAARAVTAALGYMPARALRLGSDDEPHAYVEQLARWALTGQWTSRRGTDYLAGLSAIDVPVFAASGGGDRLCRPEDAWALLRPLARPADLRVVGTRYADAIDADHFTLFTEPRLAPLWDELVGFIGRDR